MTVTIKMHVECTDVEILLGINNMPFQVWFASLSLEQRFYHLHVICIWECYICLAAYCNWKMYLLHALARLASQIVHRPEHHWCLVIAQVDH